MSNRSETSIITDIKGYLYETRNEISFRNEKNSVYSSFYCERNEMKLTFVLNF